MHLDKACMDCFSFVGVQSIVRRLRVIEGLVEGPSAEPIEVLRDVQWRLVLLQEVGEDPTANGGQRQGRQCIMCGVRFCFNTSGSKRSENRGQERTEQDILIAFWVVVRPDAARVFLEGLERGDLHGILR